MLFVKKTIQILLPILLFMAFQSCSKEKTNSIRDTVLSPVKELIANNKIDFLVDSVDVEQIEGGIWQVSIELSSLNLKDTTTTEFTFVLPIIISSDKIDIIDFKLLNAQVNSEILAVQGHNDLWYYTMVISSKGRKGIAIEQENTSAKFAFKIKNKKNEPNFLLPLKGGNNLTKVNFIKIESQELSSNTLQAISDEETIPINIYSYSQENYYTSILKLSRPYTVLDFRGIETESRFKARLLSIHATILTILILTGVLLSLFSKKRRYTRNLLFREKAKAESIYNDISDIVKKLNLKSREKDYIKYGGSMFFNVEDFYSKMSKKYNVDRDVIKDMLHVFLLKNKVYEEIYDRYLRSREPTDNKLNNSFSDIDNFINTYNKITVLEDSIETKYFREHPLIKWLLPIFLTALLITSFLIADAQSTSEFNSSIEQFNYSEILIEDLELEITPIFKNQQDLAVDIFFKFKVLTSMDSVTSSNFKVRIDSCEAKLTENNINKIPNDIFIKSLPIANGYEFYIKTKYISRINKEFTHLFKKNIFKEINLSQSVKIMENNIFNEVSIPLTEYSYKSNAYWGVNRHKFPYDTYNFVVPLNFDTGMNLSNIELSKMDGFEIVPKLNIDSLILTEYPFNFKFDTHTKQAHFVNSKTPCVLNLQLRRSALLRIGLPILLFILSIVSGLVTALIASFPDNKRGSIILGSFGVVGSVTLVQTTLLDKYDNIPHFLEFTGKFSIIDIIFGAAWILMIIITLKYSLKLKKKRNKQI